MRKIIYIFMFLILTHVKSYAAYMISNNLATAYGDSGFYSLDVDASTKISFGNGLYQFNGKTHVGIPIKVLVKLNCNSGLYKIILLRNVKVVDSNGNIKKSGIKQVDLGWETIRLEPDETRELCQ